MAFDFPNSPTNGQVFTPPGGPTYTYDLPGTKWLVTPALASVTITTGVYTPVHFVGSNVAASTSYQATYLRVGNSVIVSGLADVDPTAAGAVTNLGVSLPIVSDVASYLDVTGTFGSGAAFTETGIIQADATNNNALLTFLSVTAINHQIGFVLQYRVM